MHGGDNKQGTVRISATSSVHRHAAQGCEILLLSNTFLEASSEHSTLGSEDSARGQVPLMQGSYTRFWGWAHKGGRVDKPWLPALRS
jgi:hypothetical protein